MCGGGDCCGLQLGQRRKGGVVGGWRDGRPRGLTTAGCRSDHRSTRDGRRNAVASILRRILLAVCACRQGEYLRIARRGVGSGNRDLLLSSGTLSLNVVDKTSPAIISRLFQIVFNRPTDNMLRPLLTPRVRTTPFFLNLVSADIINRFVGLRVFAQGQVVLKVVRGSRGDLMSI